jgi:asparagine synthase (glutamine-hydrolysing)
LCGIAGFTRSNGAPKPGRIEQATETLSHRGPDRRAVFESSHISIGAARLRIIDLARGDQPMVSEDGDTVIAFNGEVYNHAELREQLESLGHRFRSGTDTEAVLEAFREWDLGCFSRLRGMFAVALWSESRQRLVLARDRMGIKPLYLARRGQDLYFGSELKSIFVHPEIERSLSLEGLDCYLALNYVPQPWTLVAGIEKLNPGHWLEWNNGSVRADAYWTLPTGPVRRSDPRAAQEHLDSLLKQSAREHLISDVPLGVWLSGGIDSSTILHYAAESTSARLKTFSISFAGRSFDESARFREVARLYGTDHHELDLNLDLNIQSAVEQFSYYSDEPTADAGALPVWFLSKMTKANATVALSGEGADELFGGYLTHRASLLARSARRAPSSVLGMLSAAARWLPASNEKIGLDYKLRRFLDGCRLSPARAHVYWNGTFSDAEKQSLVNMKRPPALHSTLAGLASRPDDLASYLWFDRQYFLPDDILNKVDRMSMAFSVEVRPPFLDHRIVEFAASLPADQLIRGSRQKVILRELMRGKLPSTVIQGPKVGFDIPAHEWMRGPLRPMLLDVLAAASSDYADLFNFPAIYSFVQSHLNRRANLGYHLWGLMTLFLWMKKWKVQPAPLPSTARQAAETFCAST